MSDVVLAAVAAAAGGVIVALINKIFDRKNNKVDELRAMCAAMEINKSGLKQQINDMCSEQREFWAVARLRFDQLEKKQDKHNGFMERLGIAERSLVAAEKSASSAHKRLDGVERRIE